MPSRKKTEFNPSGSKYLRSMTSLVDGKADVYAVLEAFDVRCPARQHAIKKLLCCGLRGKATTEQDLLEARDAIDRAVQMQQGRIEVTETGQTEEAFLQHFHTLPGIHPDQTNLPLVEGLFEVVQALSSNDTGVNLLKCERGIGVTRIFREFAKWTQLSVVVVSYNLQVYRAAGVRAFSWHHPLQGITPKPDLVLVDSPLSRLECESKSTAVEFEQYLANCPYPAFCAVQI